MASFQTDQTELMNNHSTKVSSKKKWSHCQVLIICLIIGIIAVLLSNLDRVIESSQNESSSSSSIPEINCDYPQWLTPSTFYGDFIFGSGSGKLKFCFDGDNDRFAKHFMFEGGMRNISLIYNGHDYYWMCPGEEDCATPYPAGSCTYSYMPRIPFPSNQFENYSYIGREILYQRLISGEIIQVDSHHWVGTCIGYDGEKTWATDQYFDVNNPCSIPTMNTYIDVHGLGTNEIRYFTNVVSGFDEDCFDIMDVCITPNASL